MSSLLHQLRGENTELKSEIVGLRLEVVARDKLVVELTIEIAALKKQMFGPKAERVRHEEAQLSLLAVLAELGRFTTGDVDAGERAAALLDELSDQVNNPSPDPEKSKSATRKNTKTPHGRRQLDLADLPVVRVVLEPFERTAPDGDLLVKIGEEVSHHIDHRPGSLVRVEVVRCKYLRPEDVATAASSASATEPGSTSADDSTPDPPPLVKVIIADAVELPIAKGMAGPGLLARVLVNKYGDHLPLHRQERIFKREGFALARSTLCGFVQGAVALLNRLAEAMWDDAKNSPLLLTDAAGVLIRDKGHCRRGHFQVFIAPGLHVVFKFLAKNEGAVVAELLDGFTGKLQSDASSIYHEVFRREPAIVEVGCWAHARRNFFKALAVDRPRALVGIGFIGALYDAHDAAKDPATGIVDGAKRKVLAQPVLDDLTTWRDRERPQLEVGSLIEVAMGYLVRQWTPLTRFLQDSTLRLDNNPSELELRHQVVGRKNWLFCATNGGAHWNAVVVTLLASCRMHDVEPWAYLRDVLTVLPAWNASDVLALAPARWRETSEKPETIELLQKCRVLGRNPAHAVNDGAGSAPEA